MGSQPISAASNSLPPELQAQVRLFEEQGAKVVGIADVSGGYYNPEGIDIEAAMKEAVENSSAVIAVVTPALDGQPDTAYLVRDYCQKELRWAFAANKCVLPVVDVADKGKIGALVREARWGTHKGWV